MVYDVDYFINKFEGIPENKWTTGNMGIMGQTLKCALGFCGIKKDYYPETKQSRALSKLFGGKVISQGYYDVSNVYYVNDGIPSGLGIKYLNINSPKQRILAALYDIKKMQQPEYKDATRELIESINIGDTSDIKTKQHDIQTSLQ